MWWVRLHTLSRTAVTAQGIGSPGRCREDRTTNKDHTDERSNPELRPLLLALVKSIPISNDSDVSKSFRPQSMSLNFTALV
jgi:hypothetical protein